jgi:para-nitrobenzyl esterase
MQGQFPWLRLFTLVPALVFILVSASRTVVSSEISPPTVTLADGVLEGTNFGAAQNGVAFLGVPYAAPPVGELRWNPPLPPKKWIGTRQATTYGAVCPQLPAGWLPYIAGNEDCLFLNIWTTHLSASAKQPVIVYFHGGSNSAGYSQLNPLGPTLSPLGVVVVGANYRLGPLGFLAHPALTAESEHHSSGNYGLLDQLQALQWVHENISRFGGDPGRITVMGQSAGAVDICLLMASPLASGLFQQAIMESGECQSVFNKDIRKPIQYNSISGTGEAAGQRLAADLGIPEGPGELQKLRSIPADELLKTMSKDGQLRFDAIVDGWIVPEQPAKIFAEGKELHIPILVGSNRDEATVFGHGGPKTVNEYKNYFRSDTGKYADQEFQAYPATSDADVEARFLRFHNDTFAYGAYSIARAITRVGQHAYLYYFTHAETGKRAELGAYHGQELLFLSDSFPDDWEHSREDEQIGRDMRRYWTQFANTGNPNMPGLPEWPVYEARRDQCFELGRAIRIRPVAPQLAMLERIMNQIFAESPSGAPAARSK